MTPTTANSQSTTPPFPRSMMRASAAEIDHVELHVIEGSLPADLEGHVFLVAPVGSVTSNGLPNPDNSHVWNGNGLISRFDLSGPAHIKLTTRLARTPCFWADLATRKGTLKEHLGFLDWGLVRFSLSLGVRNQLNTAFVPMRFSEAEPTRLLLTFDGGRPYEIDPVSLAVVTPVGGNSEWRAGTSFPLPFAPVLSTAHPVFDSADLTLFSVNYGRSLSNLFATIPLISWLDQWAQRLGRWVWPIGLLAHALTRHQRSFLAKESSSEDFVDLLAWDGSGPLRRWHLVDEQQKPLRIQQTMHQIGVTQDYVVLADTSVKWGLEQILPGPLSLGSCFDRLLRKLLTAPQRPDTSVYIVRKSDLVQHKSNLVAIRTVLPLETGHFLVNRDNPDNCITLYAAHEAASDVAEWLHPDDRLVRDGSPVAPELEGMFAVGAMDVGRVGRYVIDANTGKIVNEDLLFDQSLTWGVGLYATPVNPDNVIEQQANLASIYWQSMGFCSDLLPESIYQLYAKYPNRLIPLEELLGKDQGPNRRPSTLFRMDTATMSIVDSYAFPQDCHDDGSWSAWICNSPQFIPRPQPERASMSDTIDPSCHGYLFCVAISDKSKEIWIFDAANLSAGPLCRLAHPQFDPGYTIHSVWLDKIETRVASYNIDVREDYEPTISKSSKEVRDLFEKDVFPHFQAR
jgi:carotenoid cleavage dioxygenase-like enzyme